MDLDLQAATPLTLLHDGLDPGGRAVRVALAEKGLAVQPRLERPWERRAEFLALNPAGDLPVLKLPAGPALSPVAAIREYLEEVHPAPPLLGTDPLERAETRRLCGWFEGKFVREVTEPVLTERVWKRLSRSGAASDPGALRAALGNIHYHLDYIAFLTDRRSWLAGDLFGWADIAAAAQVSALDYLGDVPWERHPRAKDWYARIKSRPGFRPLLADRIAGIEPPRHYEDPDF